MEVDRFSEAKLGVYAHCDLGRACDALLLERRRKESGREALSNPVRNRPEAES